MGEVFLRLETFSHIRSCRSVEHTRFRLPFPLSLTLKMNDSSTPVTGSVSVRNAWCGRAAFLPFTVVSWSFNWSAEPNNTDLDNGVVALNLNFD